MPVFAPGLAWIDLKFRSHSNVVASAIVTSGSGIAVIDPGPTSCLPALEAGLDAMGARLADLTHILLTHVHLDHAGGVGTLVRRLPRASVLVHELGAPHLIDPSKLVRSATRLYGDQMATLWGEIAAVPRDRLTVLDSGGPAIDIHGRRLDVAYTPGHAAHHVSYFDSSSGVAFVGDCAGVRMHGDYVRPPAPPPDINVEEWEATLDRIERWNPEALFLTHFGPWRDVTDHLRMTRDNLRASAEWVRRSLGEPGTDEEKASAYAAFMEGELQRRLTRQQIHPHHVGARFEVSWYGLARYWRKKGA